MCSGEERKKEEKPQERNSRILSQSILCLSLEKEAVWPQQNGRHGGAGGEAVFLSVQPPDSWRSAGGPPMDLSVSLKGRQKREVAF